MGIRCADHVTPLYPQKLALTSPTGGGRSVGIVRSRTKATEFFFFFRLVVPSSVETTSLALIASIRPKLVPFIKLFASSVGTAVLFLLQKASLCFSCSVLTQLPPRYHGIVANVSHLHKAGESAGYCWIPGHLTLSGNQSGSDQWQCEHGTWGNVMPLMLKHTYAPVLLPGNQSGLLRESTNCELRNCSSKCDSPPSGPPGGRSYLITALSRSHSPDTWTLLGGKPAPLMPTP